MDMTEIESYLCVGNEKSVVVDISVIPEIGGMIRTITIRFPANIRIEFDSWGYDEGGLYFSAQYKSLDRAIADLESFIGKSIDRWENFTKSGRYPEKSDCVQLSPNEIALVFKQNSNLLPMGSRYVLSGNYWTSLIESARP